MAVVLLTQHFDMKKLFMSASHTLITGFFSDVWKPILIFIFSILFGINLLTISILWKEFFGLNGIAILTKIVSGDNLILKLIVYIWIPTFILSNVLYTIYRKSLLSSEIKKTSKNLFSIYYLVSWFLYLGTIIALS